MPTFPRLRRLIFLFLFICLAACAKTKVGNGGGYLGGDDASTETQVRDALTLARLDYQTRLTAIIESDNLASLYAPAGCDDSEPVCHASNLMSDEKRRFVRDLLVRTAPQALRLLQAPLTVTVTQSFPDSIADGDGHPRDADAATQLAYGSPVLLNLPVLMRNKSSELRGILVNRFTHEILHQLLGVADIAPLGPFGDVEGAREALTFAGNVMRYYSPKAASPAPTVPANDSVLVSPLGIAGGAVAGAAVAVAVAHESTLFLFVVGKQDRAVYLNRRTGNVWSGYTALPSLGKSDADSVGATEYRGSVAIGVISGGTAHLFTYDDRASTAQSLGTVPGIDLENSAGPSVATSLAPTLATRLNASGTSDLYVWITGRDGASYLNWGQPTEAAPLPGYYRFDLGDIADPVTLFTVGDRIRASVRGNGGAVLSRYYNPVTDSWTPLTTDPFTSSTAPAGAVTSTAFVYAVLDGNGAVSLLSLSLSTGTWSVAVAAHNRQTALRPALAAFAGNLLLFTVDATGLVYETLR